MKLVRSPVLQNLSLDQNAVACGPVETCIPDMVGVSPEWGLIVEAKLTKTPDAEGQLLRYRTACQGAFGERRWVLVMVFKNWRVRVPYWVVGPGSWERAQRMVAWHYQGI